MTRPGVGLPFVLEVDRRARPLSTQIVEAVVAAVRAHRLRKGDRLPGARTLAASLGVDRSTVDVAIDELQAQGVVSVVERSGARVAADLPPTLARRPRVVPATPDRGDGDQSSDGADIDDGDGGLAGGIIALQGGTPDVSLLPRHALARALRTVLLGRHAVKRLSYGDPRGDPTLRRHIAALLRETRGVNVDGGDIVVTRGSQMALDLCARALVRPGDIVVVEDPGYPPGRAAFLARGALLYPVAVDAEGLDVDEFARLLQRATVRAVVVTPHHQYPTTVTMSASRRLRLLDLCVRHNVVVIEDDYDHEFHYDGRPVAPLLAEDQQQNRAGVVVSVGSFSKILAPGLRTGWAAGPRVHMDALVRARHAVDRQGDHLLEAALAILLEEGEVARHARRMRRIYRQRRDTLVAALRARLADSVAFAVPRGGMALWLDVERRIDMNRWLLRARAAGLRIQATSSLYIDGLSRPHLRLGFAGNDDARLEEAVARLAAAL